MPSPIVPFKPSKLINTAVAAQSTAATGVKLSYVVPVAKVARINLVNILILTGATGVVNVQLIVGGVTISLTQPAAGASSSYQGGAWLNTGDTVQINVTTAVVGTADLCIAVEEYDAA